MGVDLGEHVGEVGGLDARAVEVEAPIALGPGEVRDHVRHRAAIERFGGEAQVLGLARVPPSSVDVPLPLAQRPSSMAGQDARRREQQHCQHHRTRASHLANLPLSERRERRTTAPGCHGRRSGYRAAMRRPVLAPHLAGFGTTIFAEMSALAARPGRSTSARASPTRTVRARWPRPPSRRSGPATTSTRRVPASRPCGRRSPTHQRRFWGIEVDPESQVLVTAGATEALAAAVLALCEPGDEILASSRPTTRTPPSRRWPGRRLRRGDLRAARLPRPTSTRCAPLVTPAPGSSCSIRRTTRPARCSPTPSWRHRGPLRRARPHRGDRRGLRAPGLRRRPPAARARCPGWPIAR